MNELSEEELLYASEEDIAFYKKAIEGLPAISNKEGVIYAKNGEPIPYGSGPHIIRHFRETIEIVDPLYILEIGFNMGHSSAIWLNLTDADVHVHSIDISIKEETIQAAGLLEEKYGKPIVRFEYFNRELFYSEGIHYCLCFIDGAHDEESIIKDIQLCKEMQIPYILFDDWYPRYGETQKAVAKFPELELVKDMNNLRLYKVNYGTGN